MHGAGPLVDCHAHVYTRAMPASDAAWHLPPHDATIEDYVATLDENGVLFAVLAAASIYGDYNDYALEAVRRFRRLRTTVIVRPDIELDTMKRMKENGVVGIRFQFRNVASPPDLRSYEYRRLMRRAADLDWHIHLHDEGPRLAQFITPVLDAGPRLVIDHFGVPIPRKARMQKASSGREGGRSRQHMGENLGPLFASAQKVSPARSLRNCSARGERSACYGEATGPSRPTKTA